jgi:hypothetical protein
MSTTPHPFAPEEIMAHLDGELSAAQSQSVSTHIESCSECSRLATSLRSSSQCLSGWRVGSVPPLLQDRVLAASTKASHAFHALNPLNLLDFPNRARKRWVLGLATAGGVFLFLIFVSMQRGHRDKSVLYASKAVRHQSSVTPPPAAAVYGLESEARQQLAMRDADAATEWSFAGKDGAVISAGAPRQVAPQTSSGSAYRSQLQNGPMIARTVSLGIITKDFDSSRGSLDAILVRRNGYAASLSVATPQDAARSLQASLRIPASQLAMAILELRALGRVENESQNGDEVTQQHADLVARLKNSRETEQRLQAILTQRTGKISDVLEVEQEIARVRGEIEQMEAEQKNLEHRVDFATVNLQLSEEYKAKLDSPAPAISTLIHNAAVNGYRNVADTLLSIVLFFAEYGPVLCFWLIVFFIPGWLVWRRWRHATAAV